MAQVPQSHDFGVQAVSATTFLAVHPTRPMGYRTRLDVIAALLGEMRSARGDPRRILRDPQQFLNRLGALSYVPDEGIPRAALEDPAVQAYLQAAETQPDAMRRVGAPAAALCRWVHAITSAAAAEIKFAPNRKRLQELYVELAPAQNAVALETAKLRELQELQEREAAG